ncbi:hypothetical protein [Sciscionella sediminilitoris]|uniref:hypothetical protein n=1 Tax=Sciscionella sediminilitoris TaxID=1445613 RepID=UPI00068935F2|nr:hypothetical protein [Sciscionella sp. SE31]
MNPRTRALVVRGLGVTRLIVGLSTFARPGIAPRSLGIRTDPADGGTLARMFGIRDAALAVATLSADPAVRESGLRLGLLSDAADTAAVLRGSRSGVTPRGAALIGGAAAFFALTGLAALARSPEGKARDGGA